MSQRTKPPFRADHVGSFLRPKALLDARRAQFRERRNYRATRCAPSRTMRSAISSGFRKISDLRGITDGEFRRTYFHIDFLTQLEGVETKGGIAVSFHSKTGQRRLRTAGYAGHGQGAARQNRSSAPTSSS